MIHKHPDVRERVLRVMKHIGITVVIRDHHVFHHFYFHGETRTLTIPKNANNSELLHELSHYMTAKAQRPKQESIWFGRRTGRE